MAKLDAFFKLMTEQGASDLHLASGSPPLLRVNGDLQRVRYPVLSNDDLKTMLYEVTPATMVKQFEETGDADFAHSAPGLARLPCQPVPAATRRRSGVPTNSHHHSQPRSARAAAHPAQNTPLAAGARAGHRADREWQIHHLGGADRLRQYAPQGPYPDHRGPGGIRPRQQELRGQSARGRQPYAHVRRGAAGRVAGGPGHHHGGRDA